MQDTHARRLQLREVAARSLLGPNKATATRDILRMAARLVGDVRSPGNTMMGDLKAVMIGDGYADFSGRGVGKYYVGKHPLLQGHNSGRERGSDGFLPWYSDDGFQVHHVFAALLLGRIYFGEWYAKFSEKADLAKLFNNEIEWWDIRVYEDFCPLGRAVNDTNFVSLAGEVHMKLTGIVSGLERNPNKWKSTTVELPPVAYLTGVRVRLKELGYYSGPIKGPFDPVTRFAVIEFQKKNPPLAKDGIPGPNTQRKLAKVFGA